MCNVADFIRGPHTGNAGEAGGASACSGTEGDTMEDGVTRDRRGAVYSPVTAPCMGGMCGLWEEVWVAETEGSTSKPSESVER